MDKWKMAVLSAEWGERPSLLQLNRGGKRPCRVRVRGRLQPINRRIDKWETAVASY
ncbi:MAG: hypothetical protein IPM76_03540 [Chloroflexi bacterium]|nr:hypothetical protein [Chloroflexota bacterium]